ncbi:MAG: hypothetical protein ABSH41_26300 [Syntrophobacteraceae bacterium]
MRKLFKWTLKGLIGCFGNGCLLAVAVLAASPTSNILFDETNYNFGELSETAPFSHDFIVKNGGKAVLNIRAVQPS